MPYGYRGGRNTPGFAGFVLVVAVTAGCGRLPVHPFGPASFVETPTPEPKATSAPPVATPEGPVEVEVLPILPVAGEPRVELPGTPSAASLLDSALARSRGLPDSPAPAEPASTPIASPIPIPEPLKVVNDTPQVGPTTPPPAPSEPQAETTTPSNPQAAPANPSADPAPSAQAVEPGKPTEAARPRDEWRDGIEELRVVIRGHAGESDGPWTLRALLLDALAKAGEGGEDANLWKTVLPALGATDEPQAPAERPRVDELRAAILALEDQAPLEITDLRLCRKVSGFGNFDPLDVASLKAGQAVILYCELSGLRSEARGDGFRSRLASHYEVVPAAGGEPVVKRTSLGAAEDLCRRRRRDYYANYRVDLPEGISPGTYELRLTQEDAIAGRSTSSAIPFTILP